MIDNKPYMGLYFWELGITSLQVRIEMWHAGHGLNIICPEYILPSFNLEPFTLNDFNLIVNYKKASISKLRSIIRK